MNNFLVELAKMFADGTPLDALQLQTLFDNDLIKVVDSTEYGEAIAFTVKGAQFVKTGT